MNGGFISIIFYFIIFQSSYNRQRRKINHNNYIFGILQGVHFIVSLSTSLVMGALSNRKYASAGISLRVRSFAAVQLTLPHRRVSTCSKFPADAGFLCDTAAVLGDVLKGTPVMKALCAPPGIISTLQLAESL